MVEACRRAESTRCSWQSLTCAREREQESKMGPLIAIARPSANPPAKSTHVLFGRGRATPLANQNAPKWERVCWSGRAEQFLGSWNRLRWAIYVVEKRTARHSVFWEMEEEAWEREGLDGERAESGDSGRGRSCSRSYRSICEGLRGFWECFLTRRSKMIVMMVRRMLLLSPAFWRRDPELFSRQSGHSEICLYAVYVYICVQIKFPQKRKLKRICFYFLLSFYIPDLYSWKNWGLFYFQSSVGYTTEP